jgi:hypothetical protein
MSLSMRVPLSIRSKPRAPSTAPSSFGRLIRARLCAAIDHLAASLASDAIGPMSDGKPELLERYPRLFDARPLGRGDNTRGCRKRHIFVGPGGGEALTRSSCPLGYWREGGFIS